MKFTHFLLACSLCYFGATAQTTQPTLPVTVLTAGNSWVMNKNSRTSEVVTREGITHWNQPWQIIRTYFYVAKPCKLSLALDARVPEGSSGIKVILPDAQTQINLSGSDFKQITLPDFQVNYPGYYFVDLQGISKTGAVFAEVKAILLGKDADESIVKFVKDDVYFGRRGPSVHWGYQVPNEVKEIEWFYNELEVEPGQDVVGSYFMANGFGEGYFGIQVNSPTERRILFSVWSPFHTDDPKSIPADQQIKLEKKGPKVRTGEFGNEGSGGQSFLVHNWKAGMRYKFLLHGKPVGNNSTNYTAYFFDPETRKWNLIASFTRPQTNTYLKHPHSFLENFIPDQGIVDRRCGYYNQWVADSKGNWHELNSAIFTADATAHGQFRYDYSGGTEKGGFYLRNCGFVNDRTTPNSYFVRPATGKKPAVNFQEFK